MIVEIDKSGRRKIDERIVDSDGGVLEEFTKARAARTDVVVVIRADARAPFEAVTNVMLLARRAGLPRVFVSIGQPGQDQSGKRAVCEDFRKLRLD